MPRAECSRGWGWRCPEANPESNCVCACGGENHGIGLTEEQKVELRARLRERKRKARRRALRAQRALKSQPSAPKTKKQPKAKELRQHRVRPSMTTNGAPKRTGSRKKRSRRAARGKAGELRRPTSKKWEYQVLVLNKEGYILLNGANRDNQPFTAKPYSQPGSELVILNQLGAEGWEVSAVTGYERYLLKRPKRSEQ